MILNDHSVDVKIENLAENIGEDLDCSVDGKFLPYRFLTQEWPSSCIQGQFH